MGLLSYLKTMKKAQKESKLLILGLDSGGKTTILKSVSNENIQNLKPTQGFNIKNLRIDGVDFSVWDLGGQKVLRQYWSNYFKDCSALIYVIDAADVVRLEEAGQELEALLKENDLKGVPVLVFANKQDLIHALGPGEIAEEIKLENIQDRKWMIMSCSALTGDGLKDGFDWIIENMKRDK